VAQRVEPTEQRASSGKRLSCKEQPAVSSGNSAVAASLDDDTEGVFPTADGRRRSAGCVRNLP